MSAQRAVQLAVLCLGLTVCAAAAQVRPRLDLSACPHVDARELERLLTLELRTLGADESELEELSLSCANGRVQIVARSRAQGPLHAELSVEPAGQEALTRLLALRISELVATPEPAHPAPPEPVAPPTLPSVREAPRAPERERPTPEPRGGAQAAELSFATRRSATPATWLYGANVGYGLPVGSSLVLHGDLSMSLGRADVQVAELGVRDLSVAMSLVWMVRSRLVDAGVGPGFRGAYTWLEARAVTPGHQGQSLAAPWAGPFLAARAAVHGRAPVQALLGFEVGYVAVPIRGLLDGNHTLFSLDGPWLGAQVGLAYGW